MGVSELMVHKSDWETSGKTTTLHFSIKFHFFFFVKTKYDTIKNRCVFTIFFQLKKSNSLSEKCLNYIR